MTSFDFNDIIQKQTAKMIADSNPIKLGTVTAVSSGRPIVKIDGEDEASGKAYKRLASYTPAVNDRVILTKIAGSFVVYGKVI